MFESLHLSEGSKIITDNIPGRKSIELLKLQDKLESNNRSYPRSIPIAFDLAKGSIIQDVDGNQYIDFFSGCGVVNIGHNNPYVLEALRKHEGKIIQAVDFPTETKIEFMQYLNDILPSTLKDNCKINFGGPTGSDAVESALKLARINKKRHTIIAFQGGYHGMTMGALSVTSKNFHKDLNVLPSSGVHFMPFYNKYRCPFGNHKTENCENENLDYFKNILDNPHSGVEKPAAILIEPIQGEGGTYIPSNTWLEKIVAICKERDILVIFDEIQTGFFRTGKLFAFEHTNAVPDIITMSKGIGGIGLPLSLIIYKKNLDIWHPGTHIGTFRANQMSLVAGLEAMKFIKKYNVKDNIITIGDIILSDLSSIMKTSKYIGDVRGRGMMFGIEYVKDKREREFTPSSDVSEWIKEGEEMFILSNLNPNVKGKFTEIYAIPADAKDLKLKEGDLNFFGGKSALINLGL